MQGQMCQMAVGSDHAGAPNGTPCFRGFDRIGVDRPLLGMSLAQIRRLVRRCLLPLA
jgi:hypothetical protein